LIIIDEVSMVDFELFETILEHVNSETKLLLCGDVNQLPSIGPGNILEALLKKEPNFKKNYKVCKLNKIYRLPANSALLNIIYKLRDETIIDSKDFYDETAIFMDFNKFFNIKSKNKEKEITEFIKNIKEKYKLDIKSKFLCYNTNKDYYFNVDILNKCSQKIFNPDEKDNEKIYQKNFKNNDKAIRNKNDYSDKKMRANGEEATIVRINDSEQEVTFKYTNDNRDENEVMSKSTFYEEFDLNYACTFHKSQGDGWDDIIIFISPNTTFIKKNAIYTAMSRAKKRCIFISTEEDLKKCQRSPEPIISTFLKP
jgi:exodeoxyribonuclease V alpha subunit